MTPRAWSYGLLFAGILWAALIVAAGLIMAAQTVGVEAWHDSALPQGAFTEVRSATATVVPEVRRDPLPTARVAPRQRPEVVPTPMLGLRLGRQVGDVGTAQVAGLASWYAYFPGQAAAGPALRAALGSGWRGTVVTVTANGVSVRTQLGDWCQCYGSRLIDLDRSDFARLAPLSQGLQEVTISW